MAEAKHHSRSYQCIKKTGYLIKSPTSGKMGRWRKRWIMLVDSLVATPTNSCERYARMEYYEVPESKRARDKTRNLSVMKLKGVIDLRYCIAVQPSGEKSRKYFFDVITGSSPPQGFATESQREREEWITALNEFLFSRKARSSSLHFSITRAPSTYSDVSSDYSYDHLQGYRTLDDACDFVRGGKDSSQKVRKTSRESLRKYLSADDISYKASSEYAQHIESPAQDVSSLQQQLALRYVPEIASDKIMNSELIGSGNFSMVSKGVWTTPSGLCCVALKHASGKDSTLRLLQEAVVTVQLWHPNLVNLLGILQQAKPTTLVTELCTQGCLLIHLKALKSKAVPFDSKLVSTLMKYCEHILLGLNYLTEKGFVHRYLMAKHVLVSEENVCKISGFACSELLSNEKEFTLQNDACVPVKWTAPEASMYWKFTSSSMVWSFGVMLYEIWSLGQEPYKLMANSQVIDWLLKGHRHPPPPGCFRSIYEIMIACWHPDPEMRPEPSTILKYLLQLNSESLSLSASKDVPRSSHELGTDVSSGEHLHQDLQESYLLYVNSIPNKSASSYVNSRRKSATVSKQVNFNTRWSFSEEDEESEKEEDDQKTGDQHIYANTSDDYEEASPVGEMDSERLTSFRRTLATNIHGRWSLSTRGSEHSFEESDNWGDVGLTMRQLPTRDPPTTLPLFGEQLSINSTESVDRFEELTLKQTESDGVKQNRNGNTLLSYNHVAASHQWGDYDSDSEEDDNCAGERVCDISSMEDRWKNKKVEFQALENQSNNSWSPTVDTPLSKPKMNDTEHMDVSSNSTTGNPKTPRTKPPIKPRKKLPQTSSAHPETAHSPQRENTITPSSSAPSIHTPKAAPRKHLIRAVSVHSYDHIQPYQCIADIDQQVLDRILWTPKNSDTVPVTYYNVPTVAPRNGMDDHSYEQVQRYEKIQTYETIPYHVELNYRNT